MPRLRPLALLAAGLVLGASVGIVSAAIPDGSGVYSACYETKSGTMHLIDSAVTTTCPKGQLGPVTWNQVGPAGSPGPQGSPGLLGTLDDLNGLPCASGAGDTELIKDPVTGAQIIACATGPTGLAADAFNNAPLTAQTASVACGQALTFSGTTVPLGTSDWFKISWTPTEACPQLQIELTSNPGNAVHFDVTGANGIPINHTAYDLPGCYVTDVWITSPNPVWIRVSSQYVRTSYTLRVQEIGNTSNCSLN